MYFRGYVGHRHSTRTCCSMAMTAVGRVTCRLLWCNPPTPKRQFENSLDIEPAFAFLPPLLTSVSDVRCFQDHGQQHFILRIFVHFERVFLILRKRLLVLSSDYGWKHHHTKRNIMASLEIWTSPFRGMFRKINNVFRPNLHGHKTQDGGFRSEQDYHNACTVRLVRSTSMLVVGGKTQAPVSSTLKRSKSSVSIESTLYYYQRQEDRIWLYSQNQNCLEYLEELVALRRQYTKSFNNLQRNETKATVSYKKKPAPPPPTKDAQVG